MPKGSPSSVRQICDHRVCGLLVEDPEPGPHGTGSLDEQRHRVGRHAVGGQRSAPTASASPGSAAGARATSPGRRGHVGAGQDLADRLGGRREDVLAVVDDDQHATSGQCLGHRVDDASPPCGVMPRAVAIASGTASASPRAPARPATRRPGTPRRARRRPRGRAGSCRRLRRRVRVTSGLGADQRGHLR